jgi:carotenoid cleavage dioxygenase
MMHDVAVTEHHVVWLDLPVVFDRARLGKGMPYQWDDHCDARVGIMPQRGSAPVRLHGTWLPDTEAAEP